MNGKYELDDDTFISMNRDKQLLTIFKTFNNQRVSCDKRFWKIERRKATDTTIAASTGIIGGFIAVVVSKLKLFGG